MGTWRWREDARGNAKVWAHWQNLNEDRRGNVKGPPWNGRAWLHAGPECFRIEWNLRSKSCGISFSTDRGGDETVSGSVAFPPIAIYLGASLRKERWVRRIADWVSKKSADMFGEKESLWSGSEFSIRVFDWAIWWKFFTDDRGWTSSRPKWRDGNWHPLDTFLGREKYTSREHEEAEVLVPMPEGVYRAKVKMTENVWKRPRWFAKTKTFGDVEMIDPVPIPGKGENSWDCGEDAIFGMSVPAEKIEDVIAGVVASALRDRRRHGGGVSWRPSSAEEQAPAEVAPLPVVEGVPLAVSEKV